MSRISPHIASWQERPGGWGYTGAGPGSSDPVHPVVELFISEQWVDVTEYVYYRGMISISRGASSESSRTDPATCRLTLNNRDGRFSARNPLSPYFGLIGRNTPIRVSVVRNGVRSYRFYGEVTSWPVRWDITGSDVWTDIEASGMMRRLDQLDAPLQSPAYREFTHPLRTSIVGYWPMEDGSGSTTFASGLPGHPPMTISGDMSLSSYDEWPGSDPLPVLRDGLAYVRPLPYTVTGETAVSMLLSVPVDGIAAEDRILKLSTTGTMRRLDITLGTTGTLRVNMYDNSNTPVEIVNSGNVAFGVNGERISLTMELTQDGADIDWRLILGYYNDLTGYLDSVPLLQVGGTLAGYTVGRVWHIAVGSSNAGDPTLGETSLGHLSLADSLSAYSNTASAILGWAGESASARILRLSQEEGVSYQSVSKGQSGNVVTLGRQGSDSFMSLVRESVDTDLGYLFEHRDGLTLGYRTRLSLYNQAPALTLDYSTHQLAEAPVPVDDDRYTLNDLMLTRSGGTFVRQEVSEGPLSTQSPPNGAGRYSGATTISLGTDAQLDSQASWRLHMGTVDEARYPRIELNLRHSTFTDDANMMNEILALDIGDRIVVSGSPSWLPPDDISLLVIGYSETLGHVEHDITLSCVPESVWHVGELNGVRYDRLDATASVLESPVTADATEIVVSTATGAPWVTANPPLNTNGNFEESTDEWTADGGTISRVPTPPTNPSEGSWSLKFVPDGVTEFPNAGSDLYPVVGGDNYTVQGWLRCATARDVALNINWFDAGFNYLSTSSNDATVVADVWTYFEQTAAAPLTAAYANMAPTVPDFPQTTDVLWVEDAYIRLTEANESVQDFPVDITVGGEVMTVTGISSVTSPQTFTVIRSVNGVVKPHAAGTSVNVATPIYVAL